MNEPFAKFEDGALWWRGSNKTFSYRARDEAIKLAEQFERTAETDWFKPFAEERARALREAIAAYSKWESSLNATQ